ncbi:MAG: hydroxyacid dehydrogenase [Ruminococcaceae bacterium]|nr:hydroxyacid dehydrogenase [Oscillospiraceae bacterium]
MKICVLDAATLGEDLDLSPLSAVHEVTIYQQTPPPLVRERIVGHDVVIINKVKLNRDTLPEGKDAPALICICATGYDNIDLTVCRERGIAVSNVVGYSSESVTQVTVGLVLSLVSHLSAYTSVTANGSYTHGDCANRLTPTYHEISSMTWGILGAGKIGSRVADVARALGCRVLTCRRHPDGQSVDLDTLLRESDILTIHTPLTSETRGLIGKEKIAKAKRGLILVNMARGAVTDEAALAEAVLSGHIGGLGADVFSLEPFPEDHPFFAIRNHPSVLLTPHMSWGAYEARARCLDEVLLNIQAFANGEKRNRVD